MLLMISNITNKKFVDEIIKSKFNYIFEMILNFDKFNEKTKNYKTKYLQTVEKSKFSIQYFPIKSNLEDFYQTNKFTKNSLIMQKCSYEYRKTKTNF